MKRIENPNIRRKVKPEKPKFTKNDWIDLGLMLHYDYDTKD